MVVSVEQPEPIVTVVMTKREARYLHTFCVTTKESALTPDAKRFLHELRGGIQEALKS